MRAPTPLQSASVTTSSPRRLVFISHANPEDNEFTLWLAWRLACHGYLVWADVTQLIGGETFWEGIEDAIRNHAAKTVVVLSRVAQTKDGVLDEVNLAVTTERVLKLKDFVVPLRIDDLPFNEVKPNLARKNVIDFRPGWADGLKCLLDVLERDMVPKTSLPNACDTTAWFKRVAGSQQIVNEPEPLLTNWLEVTHTPEHLYFHRVPVPDNKVRGTFASFQFPVYPYAGLVATFAADEELNDCLPSWQKAMGEKTVNLDAILADQPHNLPTLKWRDASNMLAALLRAAWDRTMQEKGLHRYELSSGRFAWFPVNGLGEGNWFQYEDAEGKRRRKQLVGRSEKRKVYWHFAAEAVPIVGRNIRFAVKSHIVFTEDAIAPLPSAARMHSLRRGFCRSWWNGRWRDLLLAYLALLGGESGLISLEVGDGQAFEMSAHPIVLTAPFRLTGAEAAVDVEETDEMLDETADADPFVEEEYVDDDEVPLDEDREADKLPLKAHSV